MSTDIKTELLKMTGISQKRGEDVQSFLARIVRAVSELDDPTWESLSSDAQDWFNGAADKLNQKLTLPELPGMNEEIPPVTRRRADPSPPPAASAKRSEPPVSHSAKEEAIASRDEADGGEKEDADLGSAGADPKVGDRAKLVTRRGDDYEGEIIEIDENEIVLKVGNEEEAFRRSKVETLVVIAPLAAAPVKTEPKAAAKDAEKPARAPRPPKIPGTKSVTAQMRDLICEHDDWGKDQLALELRKRGLEFRDSTFDITFFDTMKVITALRELGRLLPAKGE